MYKMYGYQTKAINAVDKSLQRTGAASLEMATGLGKTITLCGLLRRKKYRKVLILCDQMTILEQIKSKIEDFFTNGYAKCVIFDGDKNKLRKANIVLSTFQMMRNYLDDFSPKYFDFAAADEAHHVGAGTYRIVFDHYKCQKLGMSATPDQRMEEIFGPPCVSISLKEGIENKWLTKFRYEMISHNIDQEKLREIFKKVKIQKKKISVESINREIFIDHLNETICQDFLPNIIGRQTFIFCKNISHAKAIHKILQKTEVVVCGIAHSKNKTSHDAIQKFRDGEINVLISVGMLLEGFDSQEAEVAIILRGTGSKRIFIQLIGRILRKYPGKDCVDIYDYASNMNHINFFQDLSREGNASDGEESATAKAHIKGESFDCYLSQEIVEMLEVLDALDAINYSFEEKCEMLQKNIKKVGSKALTYHYIDPENEFRLGHWVSRMKKQWFGKGKGKALTKTEKELLLQSGFPNPEDEIVLSFKDKCEILKRCVSEYGDAALKVDFVDQQTDFNVGRWVYGMNRALRGTGGYKALSKKEVTMLKEAGFKTPKPRTTRVGFHGRVKILARCIKKDGERALLPSYIDEKTGIAIGKWAFCMKQAWKGKGDYKPLTEDQKNDLLKIGFPNPELVVTYSFADRCAILKRCLKTVAFKKIKQDFIDDLTQVKIGAWVHRCKQRLSGYGRINKLTEQEKLMLFEAGFPKPL